MVRVVDRVCSSSTVAIVGDYAARTSSKDDILNIAFSSSRNDGRSRLISHYPRTSRESCNPHDCSVRPSPGREQRRQSLTRRRTLGRTEFRARFACRVVLARGAGRHLRDHQPLLLLDVEPAERARASDRARAPGARRSRCCCWLARSTCRSRRSSGFRRRSERLRSSASGCRVGVGDRPSGIAIATLIGFINGLCVTRLKMVSLIESLGMMIMLQGGSAGDHAGKYHHRHARQL